MAEGKLARGEIHFQDRFPMARYYRFNDFQLPSQTNSMPKRAARKNFQFTFLRLLLARVTKVHFEDFRKNFSCTTGPVECVLRVHSALAPQRFST